MSVDSVEGGQVYLGAAGAHIQSGSTSSSSSTSSCLRGATLREDKPARGVEPLVMLKGQRSRVITAVSLSCLSTCMVWCSRGYPRGAESCSMTEDSFFGDWTCPRRRKSVIKRLGGTHSHTHTPCSRNSTQRHSQQRREIRPTSRPTSPWDSAARSADTHSVPH